MKQKCPTLDIEKS